jgi:cyclic pyranopterin phosphate synthase
LRLQAATLTAIAEGRAPKGDPFGPARIAGILAAKMTPQLIPFCHPIPLAAIGVELSREADGVRVRATVRTNAQTGVEMEALAAVAGALLTVWDMTKALEKDATGNYPATAIESVRVVSKKKGSS